MPTVSDPDAQGDDTYYRVLTPGEVAEQPLNDFAASVLEGLSERPKRLSSRYLYDAQGSELFQAIMTLDEYYPTRCEREIFETHGATLVAPFSGHPLNLVDLGAGDGTKTQLLLDALAASGADVRYVPVDISESAMAELTPRIAAAVPGVQVSGIVAEYASALHWLAQRDRARRNLVLFLGSNIGNFNKPQARGFLRRLWTVLNDGDCVLIGFDLKKDIDLLLHAYNDARGVTAEFNMNLLGRINRELGGNFDCARFRHYATYDVFTGAMESYLVSMHTQTVAIAALHSEFHFDAWEPIHTEYSYKYLESDIAALASSTGFTIERGFTDARGWFACSMWQVRKG